MSGLLQYNFFPTDFFYPRPLPVNRDSDATNKSLMPVQNRQRKAGENRVDDQQKANVMVRLHYNMGEDHNKFCQEASSSRGLLSPCVAIKKRKPSEMGSEKGVEEVRSINVAGG
ncbi:unnamed protein product [Prunus brigantina]